LSNFRFIDLFAGIGGFHVAMSDVGGRCVFVSEWDPPARATYEHNFKSHSPELFRQDGGLFSGDITLVTKSEDLTKRIPDFDALCAGFPCQPFSQAGLKKGLEETRGTLFFDIMKILKTKKPRAFFLENVRGLLTHTSPNGISTMEVIRQQLTDAGYHFSEHLVRASDFGVPQHRPRLFIIGFRSKADFKRFTPPEPVPLTVTLDQVMGGVTGRTIGFTLRVGGRHSGVADRRNWDTYLVDGVEKRLTSSQGLQLQGFPSWFSFPSAVTETQAMKQLGNSVAVPAIRAYAASIASALGY
jgi:DNA (cytosine-5)-methyltransferase 1